MSLPRERAIENLRKSRFFSRLRLYRSQKESEIITRLAYQWTWHGMKYGFERRGLRRFARELGIHVHWLEVLRNRVLARPEIVQQIVTRRGMAHPAELEAARAQTDDQRRRGLLKTRIHWRNLSDEERKLEREGHKFRMRNKGRFD